MLLASISTIQCIGLMIVTTTINAHLRNQYPEGSGEVGARVTAARNWVRFMATYIQIEWVTNAGAARAFRDVGRSDNSKHGRTGGLKSVRQSNRKGSRKNGTRKSGESHS